MCSRRSAIWKPLPSRRYSAKRCSFSRNHRRGALAPLADLIKQARRCSLATRSPQARVIVDGHLAARIQDETFAPPQHAKLLRPSRASVARRMNLRHRKFAPTTPTSFETAARGLRSFGFREPEARRVLETKRDMEAAPVETILREALLVLT